jgi:hypothetical protein
MGRDFTEIYVGGERETTCASVKIYVGGERETTCASVKEEFGFSDIFVLTG